MTRFYLSNLSQIWPIARQEPLLDDAYPGWREQAVYRDILSLRGLAKGERLAERDDFLLRKAGRTDDGGEVVVATLLAIARTQADLTSVLVRIAGRHEKLRSIAEDMLIDPVEQDLEELRRVFHNATRRVSARGVPGGKASGIKRAADADAKIERIRPFWGLAEPTTAALCKQHDIARVTIEARLGKRRPAQRAYAEDIRRQMHALKVAEANSRRKKHEPESDTCAE